MSDLQFLNEWIPDKMDPGTVFLLENQAKLGHAQNPYVAVMSCPRCGTMGLITRRQLCEREMLICLLCGISARGRKYPLSIPSVGAVQRCELALS